MNTITPPPSDEWIKEVQGKEPPNAALKNARMHTDNKSIVVTWNNKNYLISVFDGETAVDLTTHTQLVARAVDTFIRDHEVISNPLKAPSVTLTGSTIDDPEYKARFAWLAEKIRGDNGIKIEVARRPSDETKTAVVLPAKTSSDQSTQTLPTSDSNMQPDLDEGRQGRLLWEAIPRPATSSVTGEWLPDEDSPIPPKQANSIVSALGAGIRILLLPSDTLIRWLLNSGALSPNIDAVTKKPSPLALPPGTTTQPLPTPNASGDASRGRNKHLSIALKAGGILSATYDKVVKTTEPPPLPETVIPSGMGAVKIIVHAIEESLKRLLPWGKKP